MPSSLWPYFGDLHKVLPAHWTGVVVTLAAVVCGALIGFERQRAQKPAGARTLILICLGSAIFTQASILMAGGESERTRIAAQIVSGIGFLGAGAIIHEGGLVIGVTTGAGIWATAAVGVVVGSGQVAAGVFFSVLIVVTLAAAGAIDGFVAGPCRFKSLRLSFDPDDGKTALVIQAVLDDHQHEGAVTFAQPTLAEGQVSITYCAAHRHHRAFLGDLAALPRVRRIQQDG